jgi:1,4-alpha-glucan branching enzyme
VVIEKEAVGSNPFLTASFILMVSGLFDFGCTISDLKAGESAGKSEISNSKSEIIDVARSLFQIISYAMKSLYQLLLLFLLTSLSLSGFSQSIITDPAQPVASKKVVITFDSSKESRLGKFTEDLYAHTGVIVEGNTSWQHVIGNWGDNAVQPKLTNKGNGIYQLEISPDIKTFYSVPGSEKIRKMAFVFRSTDTKKQTDDILVDVWPEGLEITVSTPARGALLPKNTPVTITAASTQDATLSLLAGTQVITTAAGKTISGSHTFTEGGWTWIIAKATSPDKTVYDSVQVYVRPAVVSQPLPTGVLKGINYPSASSATLVLWASKKEFVYVVGDFNDWQLNDEYLMKKDGDYFWLELTGLTSGKPYIFQYFVDGQMKLADPYTNQTSDPNDQYIPTASYPGLVTYPSGKANGIASVLVTGQVPYPWEVNTFVPQPNDKLVIYELLVRDFTTERTYLKVVEKLDYLKDLGVNVLELMPVNEFEGNNSWGYNPSFYFAPDKYYGPANHLKKLIDEAHKRGMAVVIDMVLNHSYGQSPFVKMYWDVMNNRPSSDNPWYNVKSNFENPNAQWGYDFNHESVYTRQLIDSINSFWMKEYKVDGFRFDFTKGFSNTVYSGADNWGSAYDASRISNLKRMANEIWKRNPNALVIFEHLSDNSEEKELAASNILLWGNMSGAYGEAAKGNSADLTWGLHSSRSWTLPNLVTYMESHDEERVMVKVLSGGNSEGSYNTRSLPTALDRMELNALFHILLPGPKMIWQFGELGYDYSINTCENPSVVSSTCRLVPKPVLWSYFDQVNRKDVYKMYARLNLLKTRYEEFSSSSVFTASLNGQVKWFTFSNGPLYHVIAVGNFATSSNTITLNFPVTGWWYNYFQGTGGDVKTTSNTMTLAPGEFRLYTTRKMTDPYDETAIPELKNNSGNLQIYPNPVREKTTIQSGKGLGKVTIQNLSGQIIFQEDFSGSVKEEIELKNLVPGIYLIQSGNSVGKIIKH